MSCVLSKGNPLGLALATLFWAAAVPGLGQQVTLFTENFDGLTSSLQPPVDECDPADPGLCGWLGVWTDTPPAGWTVDDSGIPGYDQGLPGRVDPDQDGITEWNGWSFAKKDWWAQVAGDQNRTQFAKGVGIVAIADPDEWDDAGHPSSLDDQYDAFMTSPEINIADIPAGALTLTFDSSWRPEGPEDEENSNQTAEIWVSFDGGAETQVLHWDSIPESGFYHPDSTNETVTVNLNNPGGNTTMRLKFGLTHARNDWWWAIDNLLVKNVGTTVYSENFESLVSILEPAEEEDGPAPDVWTPNGPSGWTVDRSGVYGNDTPGLGVTEFKGWNFIHAPWWSFTARDQQRSAFASGTNIIAVADPDEWDDLGDPDGSGTTTPHTFNSYLNTPPISLATVGPNSVKLRFRSSWRDEDTQTAVVNVSFDGADPVEVLRWESQAGPNFHNDATNEQVEVAIENPLGAQNMVISFGLINARDDWWWALDRIEVTGSLPGDITEILREDFDDVPLGLCQEESCPTTPPIEDVWTKNPPAGWSVDRTGVPGVGDPNQGAEEFEGWTFLLKDWWVFTAGDQDRGLFSKGTGVVAVADPDEWDDLGNPDGMGTFNSFMSTPSIPIAGKPENTLALKFDSSWRDEGNQTASITVSYDGGAEVEILRWESQAGPNFHDDNTNESVEIPLNNPAGATHMVIKFGLTNAVNNWFWAVDNIVVSDGNATVFSEDFESVTLGPKVSSSETAFPPPSSPTVWTEVPPTGWSVDDTQVPGFDQGLPGPTPDDQDGTTEWAGWAFADPAWWTLVAGDQDRSQFTKGSGAVAIADADEWDDRPHPGGSYNAFMSTPVLNVKGVQPGHLYAAFDSSWKSWDPPFNLGRMTAVIDVSYDGAEPTRVMRWANYPGWPPEDPNPPGDPDYKPDALNESALVPLLNPRSDSAQIRFGLIDAGNDWWWAIDNLVIFALAPGSDPVYDFDADGDVDQADFAVLQICLNPVIPLTASSPANCLRADYEPNTFVNEVDLGHFIACFSGPDIPADPACDD